MPGTFHIAGGDGRDIYGFFRKLRLFFSDGQLGLTSTKGTVDATARGSDELARGSSVGGRHVLHLSVERRQWRAVGKMGAAHRFEVGHCCGGFDSSKSCLNRRGYRWFCDGGRFRHKNRV